MNSGLLREDMGRYHHSRDQLHLGASGFRMLVTMIKEKVFGCRVDGRAFSNVVDDREVRGRRRDNFVFHNSEGYVGGLKGSRNSAGNDHRSKYTDNGEAPPIHNYNGEFPPLGMY